MSFSLTSRQHGQHLAAIACDPIKLLPPFQQHGRKSTIEKPALRCLYILINSIAELISPAYATINSLKGPNAIVHLGISGFGGFRYVSHISPKTIGLYQIPLRINAINPVAIIVQ